VAELLSGVDVFVAAVEAGGFAAAGERLHLTRSDQQAMDNSRITG
jgi:hypothetical protein